MKIYGQSFSQIFKNLAFPYKVVVVAGTLFILFAIVYVPYSIFTYNSQNQEPGPIVMMRANELGGFLDPSLAYADHQGLMAFTTLKLPQNENVDFSTEIYMATSSSDCESFSVSGPVFETKAEELMGPDGITPVTTGIWRAETPTIIHDPDDKGREWKVYAYKYFWAKNIPLARMYSLIALKTSSSPTGPWSQEEWVFSANKERPAYPYAGLIAHRLNTLDPSLQNVYFYSRPSALQVNNVILMTLSAFLQGANTPDRIVLIASTDHGRSWKYLGTPLTNAMAPSIGPYTKLSGASLIEDRDTIYLAAVFGDARSDGLGTVLIPFDDVLKGTLSHDAKTGKIKVMKSIPLLSLRPTTVGGGFAAYNDACATGILSSELSGLTGRYEIFKSYQTPASKK